ncbi:MAG: hypothetical protein ACTJGR_10170 [Pauljensenia sp.]
MRVIDGAPVLSLDATALTAAMSLPEEQCFTIAAAAPTELSHFDRRAQEVCRVREEEVRVDFIRFVRSDMADPERVVAVVHECQSRMGVSDVDR